MGQITVDRAEDQDSWGKTMLSMCATDCQLNLGKIRVDTLPYNKKYRSLMGKPEYDPVAEDEQQANGKKPMESLEAAFKRWTIKYHAFEGINIEENNRRVARLTDGAKHNFHHDKEKGEYMIPSLKYFEKPKEKRFNGMARPLTHDQKTMNGLFFDLCKDSWNATQTLLLKNISTYVEEKMVEWKKEQEKKNIMLSSDR